jgi:hypothetical protein
MRDMQSRILEMSADADMKFNEIELRLNMIETQLIGLAEDVRKVNARLDT